MIYNPDNDILQTDPGRTNSYARGWLKIAIRRLEVLIGSLPLEERCNINCN